MHGPLVIQASGGRRRRESVVYELYARLAMPFKVERHFESAKIWIQNHTLDPASSVIDKTFKREVSSHPYGLFRTNTKIDISVISLNEDVGVRNFSVRTNNAGLLSESDYSFERDPDTPEYRIAMLGESFTGTVTATYQWVDTLEQLLNKNHEFLDFLKVKRVRVLNHGWVGGGFQTFWREYDQTGRHFSPDLNVVNYLELDFPRKVGPQMTDPDEMVQYAAEHLRKLNDEVKTFATVMPDRPHIEDMDKILAKTNQLKALVPEIDIFDMREHLDLPDPIVAAQTWFNIPHDYHYSDRGGEFYSRAMAKVITRQIMGEEHDYSQYTTKHFDEVVGEGKPITRNIRNSTHKLSNVPEEFRKMVDYVIDSYIESRMYRSDLYLMDALTRSGYDGVTPPFHLPLTGAFHKFTYANGEEALMNIFCTKPPLNLHNPDCYTYMHTYVNTN